VNKYRNVAFCILLYVVSIGLLLSEANRYDRLGSHPKKVAVSSKTSPDKGGPPVVVPKH
jgi:hypothetical protein